MLTGAGLDHEKTLEVKSKDSSTRPTHDQRSRGGDSTARVHAMRRAVASGEVAAMRDTGSTWEGMAKHYGVSYATLHKELEKTKAQYGKSGKELVPGREYGKMIFDRVVHGATLMYLFHHVCGWRETFTELQWKERKA